LHNIYFEKKFPHPELLEKQLKETPNLISSEEIIDIKSDGPLILTKQRPVVYRKPHIGEVHTKIFPKTPEGDMEFYRDMWTDYKQQKYNIEKKYLR
jgi:hypothetical protein